MLPETRKLIGSFLYIAYAIFMLGYIYYVSSDISRGQRETTDQLTQEISKLKSTTTDPREQLRNKLLKTPFNRQYIFLDRSQIEEQFARLGDKAIQTAAEVEYSRGLQSSGSAAFGNFLKSEIGEETIKKVKEIYALPNQPLSSKYEYLEALAIKQDLAIFGIESLSIAAGKVDQFSALTNNLQNQFGLKLDPSLIADKKRQLTEEAVPKVVADVRTGPKNALLRGEFSLRKLEATRSIRLTFDHPLNHRFGLKKKLVFETELSLAKLNDPWKGKFAKDRKLELAVFGALLKSLSDTEYRWEIIPLAIYLY